MIRDKSERCTHLVVEFAWEDEFVEPGKSNKTYEKSKKYLWNPDEHSKVS